MSRFGCACRVSSLPLFPKESAGRRCIALFGDGGGCEGYLLLRMRILGGIKARSISLRPSAFLGE
ncbi:hypothetical protein [Rossellomorea marisflavi]|uniref:hypothetical protein n=1 Tax=Rossellomorea marisflavi TaxID=189381 RepID=UPI003458D465